MYDYRNTLTITASELVFLRLAPIAKSDASVVSVKNCQLFHIGIHQLLSQTRQLLGYITASELVFLRLGDSVNLFYLILYNIFADSRGT